MSVTDEPAGLTIRREKFFFDDDGRPHWGDMGFVVLTDVEDMGFVVPLWFPLLLVLSQA